MKLLWRGTLMASDEWLETRDARIALVQRIGSKTANAMAVEALDDAVREEHRRRELERAS